MVIEPSHCPKCGKTVRGWNVPVSEKSLIERWIEATKIKPPVGVFLHPCGHWVPEISVQR